MNKLLNSKVGMVAAIAIAGLGVAYLAEKKARKVASDVGNAINPINNDNVFASGVDAVGAKLTGKSNFKLGIWIHDKIHGTPEEQLAELAKIENP